MDPRAGLDGCGKSRPHRDSIPASALDGGGWSTSRPGRFNSGKDPVPIVQEAMWDPELVWMCAENLAPHRDSIPGPFGSWRVAIPTELSRPNIVT